MIPEDLEPKESTYHPTGMGDAESYRLAFDESTRALDLLDQRLSRLYTSYIAVLAFVGTGTAFLAGTVLTDFQRTGAVVGLSAVASVFLISSLAIAVWDLWPRHRHGGTDTEKLVRYIEGDISPTYKSTLAALATQNSRIAEGQRKKIARVARRFAVFLALSTSSTVVWLAVAWIAETNPAP